MNIPIDKFRRKFTYLAGRIVPFNSSFKPDGYYATLSEYMATHARNGAMHTEIIPAQPFTLDTDDPFYLMCTDYLKPQPLQTVPPAYVVRIPNGRLYTNVLGTSIAVISPDNKVIGDITYQYVQPNVEARLQDNDIFKQQFFTKPRRYNGTLFSLLSSGRAHDNYYHWLFDALPKLYLLKESGWFEKVDWFLVPSASRKFQRETLRLLGVDAAKIVEGSDQLHIQADTLIVTSFIRHMGHIPAWAYRYHRKAFAKSVARANQSPYLYIGRGDSKIRQVLNEPELIKALEDIGFKTYILGKLPFADQVQLFDQAKIIVSAHGAGLTNITFCRPGTQIIEFFAKEYVKPTYQIISKNADLNYQYLICRSDAKSDAVAGAKNVHQASHLNVYADVAGIRALVEQSPLFEKKSV